MFFLNGEKYFVGTEIKYIIYNERLRNEKGVQKVQTQVPRGAFKSDGW